MVNCCDVCWFFFWCLGDGCSPQNRPLLGPSPRFCSFAMCFVEKKTCALQFFHKTNFLGLKLPSYHPIDRGHSPVLQISYPMHTIYKRKGVPVFLVSASLKSLSCEISIQPRRMCDSGMHIWPLNSVANFHFKLGCYPLQWRHMTFQDSDFFTRKHLRNHHKTVWSKKLLHKINP